MSTLLAHLALSPLVHVPDLALSYTPCLQLQCVCFDLMPTRQQNMFLLVCFDLMLTSQQNLFLLICRQLSPPLTYTQASCTSTFLLSKVFWLVWHVMPLDSLLHTHRSPTSCSLKVQHCQRFCCVRDSVAYHCKPYQECISSDASVSASWLAEARHNCLAMQSSSPLFS